MSERRYIRQARFPAIGEAGQEKIQAGAAVIIGCGALGTVIANSLVRSGVGRIRIIDRDFVEPENLQSQILFDEQDARRRLPKAVAAAEKLRQVNTSISIEPVVCDVNPRNVEGLIEGFSVALDATDNMESRFLLNDAAVKKGVPWIYGAAVGSTGMVMPIVPGRTACLRCLMTDVPPAGSLPTCESAGVLNSITAVVASLQSTMALQLLLGTSDLPTQLVYIDVWEGLFENLQVTRTQDCITCVQRRFEFLEGGAVSRSAALCGRNAVQILPAHDQQIDLETLARTLSEVGEVLYNGFLLTLKVADYELNVFPNGRAIIKGTSDTSVARSLYARYLGM